MNARVQRRSSRNRRVAGFSLVEALVSVALMGLIVAGLSAVTGQWAPNWNHGFVRVQNLESVDVGLQRLVSDLEAAEFVTPDVASKTAIFVGDAKSVILVRVANAPGAAPHLEFVQLAETVDERGFALVRSHAPFRPLDPNLPFDAQMYFADPVVLVRAPYRVSFAFAGADRFWRDSWRNEVLLPSAARIQVRNAATDEVLAVSTAALLHADLPAECVTQHSLKECIDGMRAQPGQQRNRQGQPAGNPP
jgi:general secretion pathway protein J